MRVLLVLLFGIGGGRTGSGGIPRWKEAYVVSVVGWWSGWMIEEGLGGDSWLGGILDQGRSQGRRDQRSSDG